MCSLKASKSQYFSILGLVLLFQMINTDAYSQATSTETTSGINGAEVSRFSYEARGFVRSSLKIEYRTDLNAPISKVPILEGMSFSKDDLLVEFDCRTHLAELKAIEARANAAWIDHKSKKRLLRHGAIGRDEVSLAAAKALEASAQVDVQKAKNISCSFVAPFSGRIVELNTQLHEFPRRDKPLMIIINDSTLELEMVVPSNWLNWLEIGLPFKFNVDETGKQVVGHIARVGAEVEPISQTIKVVGEIKNEQKNGEVSRSILSGMSGTAFFESDS